MKSPDPSTPADSPGKPPTTAKSVVRLARVLLFALAWPVALLFALWTFGALWFDLPAGNAPAAVLFPVALALLWIRVKGAPRKLAATFAACLPVLAWWLTLRAPLDADWEPNLSRTGWAEINGDRIIVHNVRDTLYPGTETDASPRWETRTYDLSKLTGVDLFLNYWGVRWMAHPILSFQFEDAPPLCFSIEIRKQNGQAYSALRGIYRQYALIYIPATEADVIKLRSHVRSEEVFHYPLTYPPETARGMLLGYLEKLNTLHDEAKWYNAITMNCTTSIRAHTPPDRRAPWDWRILINGFSDEWLHERGLIDSGGKPFPEFRASRLINPADPALADPETFSKALRRAGK